MINSYPGRRSDAARFYFADCWHSHVAPSCCPDIRVLSSNASASRTKARPTALSRQLDFSTRTTNFRSHPGGRTGTSGTGAKGEEGAKGVSIPAVEFPRRVPDDPVEGGRNFSRSSRTPSLHILLHPSVRPRFSLLFRFFFSLSFFLSFFAFPPFSYPSLAFRVVCTGAKLSVISDGMARLTPARFYAPSWITCARTSIVCTRAWRWKLEKKRNSVPKCRDASIMKHGGIGEESRDVHGFMQRNS